MSQQVAVWILLWCSLCAADFSRASTVETLPEGLLDFDAYVERVRETFDVPGMAVAIVKDGQVVLERGYGVRRLDTQQPVDARTLFAIASNTKAFTAASLEMLAEEGKLDMDARVVDYLPWFRMSDPYVSEDMRVRDLLAHHSGLGLGAGDLLFWPGTTYTTEEVARRLRHVPLARGFRSGYAYDNILYGVAQLVVEQVSGQSYRQFLQQRFFNPLGMRDTRFNSDALKPSDNVATGYARADFKELQPAIVLSWHNVSGAGGIYSSVHDMSRWLAVQLNHGAYVDVQGHERRLFSEERQRRMWSMITPITIGAPSVPELALATPNFLGYGEGWMLSDFRGEKLVWHTGGWPGMVSRVTLVPEHNLGVVVLTSQESGAAFNAVTMQALDAFLRPAQPVDWITAYQASVEKQKDKADERWQKHLAERDPRSRPSLPLTGYAAQYQDAWYGDVSLTLENARLVMRFSKSPLLVGDLEHWQHDTFLVKWRERSLNGDAFVTFSLDPDGRVREIRMQAASDLTDFSFDFQDLLLKPAS